MVSDSLGETAEFVARAAASQFDSGQVEIRRVPYVSDIRHLEEVVEEASGSNAVIAYTLILPEFKARMQELSQQCQVPAVDILGPMVEAIAHVSRVNPRLEVGLLRKLDEQYFRKVEAVEFAVKYDDGKDPRGLLNADIVLIGVSRTSKTPVSMYLAHKRIKVANVPLVPEVAPPDELFKLPVRKVVGLTIDAGQLNSIRQERLKTLGLSASADYASKQRILLELDYAHGIMQRIGCPIIDVTNRAVEETASKVLEIYQKGERYGR